MEIFDIKIPINKEIEKRHRKDINNYSLTGKKNEKKLMSFIAHGKTEIMNYLSLFINGMIIGNIVFIMMKCVVVLLKLCKLLDMENMM